MISQKEAIKLLNLSAELVVELRSYGYHLNQSNHIDGKSISPEWSGSELEKHILKLRKKL